MSLVVIVVNLINLVILEVIFVNILLIELNISKIMKFYPLGGRVEGLPLAGGQAVHQGERHGRHDVQR